MKGDMIKCGFVPLLDAAPLIAARELGFDHKEGFELVLKPQPSWSALRDHLATAQIDAAHMLAPMPIAMSLGISGLPMLTDALMTLSVGGTLISAAPQITAAMQKAGWDGDVTNPQNSRMALRSAAQGKLRIGVPFPFSMHRLLFEYWDLAPEHGAEIRTVPPHLMSQAMREGSIDLCFVGEPWGQDTVAQADASVILTGGSIWRRAPEKILGVRKEWAESDADRTGALMRAIYRACKWLDHPENRPLALEILLLSPHFELPEVASDHALNGRLMPRRNAAPITVPDFITFHESGANFPWRSQATWMAQQMASSLKINPQTATAIAEASFRSDLYRQHLSKIGADLPAASFKIEGALREPTAVASSRGGLILAPDQFFDGKKFDVHPKD